MNRLSDYSDDFEADDMHEEDRAEAVEWARYLVSTGDFVVLDTETTGLKFGCDVPVQIAIVHADGTVLLDALVNPGSVPITAGAKSVHGIGAEQVANAPSWAEVSELVRRNVAGERVVIYNANYDMAMIKQADAHAAQQTADYVRTLGRAASVECAMERYAAFYGEWNDYHGNYRWQKLTDACRQLGVKVEAPAHSALGDCLRTLAIIKAMAAADFDGPETFDEIPY